MNMHKADQIPDAVREIRCTTTLGGFLDAPLIVASKSPLFVRVTNGNGRNVICTLSATLDDKDDNSEFSFGLESNTAFTVQIDTSPNGTYRWRLDASTSNWDELQIVFLVTG